jgi:non-heme chloroperoxidase
MMTRMCRLIAVLVALPAALRAQAPPQDTSPHVQRFVRVSPSVSLEVLDWGGTGRPVVLLAGRGNTAHVFDDFARKLTPAYRVLGVTRRGYGNSTRTVSGFLADSLADDVLAVMDSLGVRKPVVIGHSIAGQELSSIGSRFPAAVAGLVYLDAGAHFAFFDSSGGHSPALLRDTQRKLARLADPAVGMTLGGRGALIEEILDRLPVLERDLRAWQDGLAGLPDQSRVLPAADSNPVSRALAIGQQIYTSVRAPVLAFFALPSRPSARIANDSAARAYFYSRRAEELSRINAFERGIPTARVVILPDANHYVFRSHEADVVGGIHSFIAGLPPSTVAAESKPGGCRERPAGSIAYLVDDTLVTCEAAMRIPRALIRSVDVFKGAAALAYGVSLAEGVVVIRTKPER